MLQQVCRSLVKQGLRTFCCGLGATGSSQSISTSASLHDTGAGQVGPAEAAREQGAQAGDTDYNATPQYPNESHEDAGDAAMAASRTPHPSGPMDTSSVNDPSGRAEGSYQQQQQQGQGSTQSSDSHAMHVHHPGHEADVAGLSGSGNSSGGSDFQASMTAGSGGASQASAARVDAPGSDPSAEGMEGPGNLEAGMQAANVVPGSERAMTADFAAGGDDVDPPGYKEAEHDSAPVNADTGLPHMSGPGSAGSGSGRFGGLKNPGDVGEEGVMARQTDKSTGMDPGDLGSG